MNPWLIRIDAMYTYGRYPLLVLLIAVISLIIPISIMLNVFVVPYIVIRALDKPPYGPEDEEYLCTTKITQVGVDMIQLASLLAIQISGLIVSNMIGWTPDWIFKDVLVGFTAITAIAATIMIFCSVPTFNTLHKLIQDKRNS